MAAKKEIGIAYIQIIPSLKGAAQRIREELGDKQKTAHTQTGQTIGSNITAGIQNAATAATAAIAATIGTAFAKGFSRLAHIDQAKAKLKGLGHDAKTIETVMQNATAAVTGTAYGLDAAATAAAGALAAGVKPGQELERTLKLVADASSIAGVDMGSMGAIFNKVAASNKIQMDVINQLHDAGIPALQLLAKQLGLTAEETQKLASQGKIDFATFQQAMQQGLGGAALATGETFKGALANVGAALGRVGANLLNGVFPLIVPMLKNIQAALKPIEHAAAALGDTIGQKLAPTLAHAAANIDGIKQKITELAPAIAPLTAAFIALGSGGIATFTAAIPGLSAIAPALAAIASPAGIAIAALTGLTATSPELQAAFTSLLAALQTLTQALTPHITLLATLIGQTLTQAATTLAQALAPIITGLANIITTITPLAPTLTAAAAGIITYLAAMKTWQTITATAAAATRIAAIAQAAFNTALTLNPIGLVIAALAAVTYALIWFFTKTQTGKQIFENLAQFFTATWEGIKNVFATATQTIGDTFQRVAETIAAVIGVYAQSYVNIFNLVKTGVTEFWNFLTDTLTAITTLTATAWAAITQGAATAWANLTQFLTATITGITTIFTTAWEGIKTAITTATQATAQTLTSIWATISQAAYSLGANIVNGIQHGINFIASIPARVTAALSNLGSLLVGSGRALIDGFIQGISSAISRAVSVVRNGLQHIRNLFPFSPAKTGPFAGRGWVAYSGQSIGKTFTQNLAAALQQGRQSITDQMAEIATQINTLNPDPITLQTTLQPPQHLPPPQNPITAALAASAGVSPVVQNNSITMVDKDPRFIFRQLNRELEAVL